MFRITVRHVQYHRASCSVPPCVMFSIAMCHVQYHRTSCSVPPCVMFSIAVRHVQYRRASYSVSPHIMVSIALHLPELVHYTVHTKSHKLLLQRISSLPAARLRCQKAQELSCQSLMRNRNVNTNLSATHVDLRNH